MGDLTEQTCLKTGKKFIEHEGTKFWLHAQQGRYVSQKKGKAVFLHRVLFWDGDPEKEVQVINGNRLDLSSENWVLRPKGTRRHNISRPFKVFDRKRFFENKQGYWVSKSCGYMHRYVWAFYHGEVPEGYNIHHRDQDKSNNDIKNLQLISKSEHSALHNKISEYIGSEAHREQMRRVRADWMSDPENREKLRKAGDEWRNSKANKKQLTEANRKRWNGR